MTLCCDPDPQNEPRSLLPLPKLHCAQGLAVVIQPLLGWLQLPACLPPHGGHCGGDFSVVPQCSSPSLCPGYQCKANKPLQP